MAMLLVALCLFVWKADEFLRRMEQREHQMAREGRHGGAGVRIVSPL